MKYTVAILIMMVVVHHVSYEFVNTQQPSCSGHPPDSRGIPVWMFFDHSNERRTLAFRATQAIEMNLVACGPRKERTDTPERPVKDAKRGHDQGHDLMERGTLERLDLEFSSRISEHTCSHSAVQYSTECCPTPR